MYSKDWLCLVLISFLILTCYAQGQNSTNINDTVLLSSTSPGTTFLETNKTSVECPANSKRDGDKCIVMNQVAPSRRSGRGFFLVFIGCLLTVFLIVGMLFAYSRFVQQSRRRSSLNTATNSTSTNSNSIGGRFDHFLRSIGFNGFSRRNRFSFFSISNNNHGSGHHRQPETSRTHLSENPDEALLFDDPYADGGLNGGLHNPSANPYKSLTLAVT